MNKIDIFCQKIKSKVKKLPLCSSLEQGIIRRLKRDDFLENQLVRIFVEKNPERLERLLEGYKNLGINYQPVIKKLNDDIDAYPSYLAELQAAKFLIEKLKINNIAFLSDSIIGKNPDFQFNYPNNSDLHYCEVKSLMELYPEYGLIYNKLAAKSYYYNKFKAYFSVLGVEYKSQNNAEKNKKFVKEELEDFVNQLDKNLVTGKNVKLTILTKNKLKLSIQVDYSKAEFQFSFGGSAQWISEINAFEILNKSFSLLIERLFLALQQIKEKKSNDLLKDIIVIYLNIDFRNKIFFDEYIQKAVNKIIDGLQLSKFSKVEIIP